MSAAGFVPKSELLGLMRRVAASRESGFITIVTDSRRSVLLRFAAGRITSSHCRSRDIGDAVQVLAESASVRFSWVKAAFEDRKEVMPLATFVQLINPEGSAPTGRDGAVAAPPLVDAGLGAHVAGELEALATELIGPIAAVIVETALVDAADIDTAIDRIAGAIPEPDVSNAFVARARERFAIPG